MLKEDAYILAVLFLFLFSLFGGGGGGGNDYYLFKSLKALLKS